MQRFFSGVQRKEKEEEAPLDLLESDLTSGGQSMDDSTRTEMESKMGTDFSGVKIHTDANAHSMNEQVNAKAFTYGQNVFFRSGNYNPNSKAGKELLAHELVHTVQQSEGVQRKIQRKENDPYISEDEKAMLSKYGIDYKTIESQRLTRMLGLLRGVGRGVTTQLDYNIEARCGFDNIGAVILVHDYQDSFGKLIYIEENNVHIEGSFGAPPAGLEVQVSINIEYRNQGATAIKPMEYQAGPSSRAAGKFIWFEFVASVKARPEGGPTENPKPKEEFSSQIFIDSPQLNDILNKEPGAGKPLSQGSSGDAVWRVQQALQMAYVADGITQDELDNHTFGPTTRQAVMDFQTIHSYRYGLVVDGIVGPATLRAMDAVMIKEDARIAEETQQVESEQAHLDAVALRAEKRKEITRKYGIPRLPVPEMNASALAFAGMNVEDFTFVYEYRAPIFELPGTGGSRYNVFHKGIYIGDIDVQWHLDLGGSIVDDYGYQLLKDHYAGTGPETGLARKTDQELFQISIDHNAGITLQTMVLFGFMGYRAGMTNEEGLGFSIIELTEGVRLAMTPPPKVNIDPRSANAPEPVEAGSGKGVEPGGKTRGTASPGVGKGTETRTGNQNAPDPAAAKVEVETKTGDPSARTDTRLGTDPAVEGARGEAKTGPETKTGSEARTRTQSGVDPATTVTRTQTKVFPRTQAELDALADDPAIGRTTPKTIREREVGLALEGDGRLEGPITRDPTGNADFIEANGTKWDVKTFTSKYPNKPGNFDLNTDILKIEKDLKDGENVIIDYKDLSPNDLQLLRNEVEARGWNPRVIFYP